MTWNEYIIVYYENIQIIERRKPMDVNFRLNVCTYDDLSFHFYRVYEKCESRKK